jgi:hypothetical protein
VKNYTAQIKATDDTLNIDRIKNEVERVLLRAHPHLTYKLGSVSSPNRGVFLVEIATDAKKQYLADVLKGVDSSTPFLLQQVGWGWLVSPLTYPEDLQKVGYFGKDPLKIEKSQPEATKVYMVRRKSLVKILALFLLFLSIILFFAIGFYLYSFNKQTFYDRYYLAFTALAYLGIILVMSGSPVFPWMYPLRIQCDPMGIEIKSIFRLTSRRLDWKEISGLELYPPNRYIIQMNNHKRIIRFIDRHSLGSDYEMMLVKTIIERASLNFVEVNVGKVVYRKFDAP